MSLSRRALLVTAATLAAAPRSLLAAPKRRRAKVFVVKEARRPRAVQACLEAAAFTACRDKPVSVKANFNSADPFPASTHPDTLAALFASLKARGAGPLTFAERSGMGDTVKVLEQTGARAIAEKAGAQVIVLDEVDGEGWRFFEAPNWPKGFLSARIFSDAPCVVQTMCCKTHRFGGQVTLALKNTIGILAKQVRGEGHNYMQDLHASPYQRQMIAEANRGWAPAMNLMDCLEAFTAGGPEKGTRAAPGLFLASEDMCALDAAAIALLRLHGMKGPAAEGPIGKTDQLARALELDLGAAPDAVQLVAVNGAAKEPVKRLSALLSAG
jgi:uncharacterized protein (DUF362 family)